MRIHWLFLVIAFLLTPTLSLAARLYRAPDNLFAINVPDSFKPLGDMGSGGNLLVKTGFQYRSGRTRAYFGIHVYQHKSSLTNFIDEHRQSIRKQPNHGMELDENTVVGGALAHMFHYSFAYDDDKSYRIIRRDTLLTLRRKGVLLYLETSKKALREVEGLFNETVASFRSAHIVAAPPAPQKAIKKVSAKIRFCTECGKNRVLDGRFCPYCGAKYRGSAPAEQRVNKPQKTETSKAPEPKIVIHGSPPLTEKTMAIWRMLLEWTARSRLTSTQEHKLRQAIINEYRQGGSRRVEMISLDKDFNPTKLYQLEKAKAEKTRNKLKKQFLTLARSIRSTNKEGAVFEEIIKAVETKLVRAEPPLTSQTRDAAIELVGFMGRLLADEEGAAISTTIGGMTRIRFGSKLRHRWPGFTKDLRKRYSDLVYLWSDTRLAWEFADQKKRKKIAKAFKEDARIVARRPAGVVFSGSRSLSSRLEDVLAERPGVLVNLAKSLDEKMKKILGKSGS